MGGDIVFFMTDIIEKKKRGLKLSKEEIQFVIDGYVNGGIPDYQIWLCLWQFILKEWTKMRQQILLWLWLTQVRQ